MKIENVGQLKNLLKDLNDDLPVGVYHKNWWYPEFETKSVEIEIIKQEEKPIGLAAEIDYTHNYLFMLTLSQALSTLYEGATTTGGVLSP